MSAMPAIWVKGDTYKRMNSVRIKLEIEADQPITFCEAVEWLLKKTKKN